MSFALSIQDESTSGELLTTTILQFPAETVTVKALIETRVAQEVERQQSETSNPIFSLVVPRKEEAQLNSKSKQRKKTINVVEQQEVAIHAFQNNGFFLLVNDRQLTELDDTIQITPNSKVVFIKLIPLVGG
jgi:hypothetical protein